MPDVTAVAAGLAATSSQLAVTASAALAAAGTSQLVVTASVALAAATSSQFNVTAFTGFTSVLVLLLLLLARTSQSVLADVGDDGPGTVPAETGAAGTDADVAGTNAPATGADRGNLPAGDPGVGDVDASGAAFEDDRPGGRGRPVPSADRSALSFTTPELLVNVVFTHGLFAGLVAGAAVYWGVPPAVLGVARPAPDVAALGVGIGLVLYLADEVGAAAAERLGVGHQETLRELLAPDSTGGWVLLLGAVLPVVAVAEELLFRGVLVGAFAAGLGVSPWALAVVSSALFALGHGAQGRGGIVVTGLLGFVLAVVFVATGSLLVVVVAHYVVNALEFLVHEGLGVEWT